MEKYKIKCTCEGYTLAVSYQGDDLDSTVKHLEKQMLEVAMSMNGVHGNYEVLTKIEKENV